MRAREESRGSAGWWANRSIRTKGLVVIALPIAVLLAVLGSTSWFTHVNSRSQTLGLQSRQALSTANALQTKVLEADNAVRGYLLTGEAQFLGNYRSAESSAPRLVTQLRPLAEQTSSSRSDYSSLSHDTEAVLGDLASLASRVSAPLSSPATESLLRSSETDSARFGDAVSTFQGAENAAIAVQRSAIHRSSTFLLAISIGATVLAIGGGLALTQLFTSGVTTRLRRLERATDALEVGELPIEMPGGSDEIGRLSQRVVTAASQLRDRADERDGVRRQLEDILTASPVVSLRYDVAGRRFSYASPNLMRLLGITSEQALSDPASVVDRFHPDDAHRLRDLLVGALDRRGERVEIVLRFRRDPASEKWGEAEAIYTLEHDSRGDLVGVVAYFVDASERHLAQRAADERRSMLESIFHASPDTIVVRDVTGRVILASSTLADLIGVSADASGEYATAHGGPVEETAGGVSPEDLQLLESLTARCIAGELTPDPVITSGRLHGGRTRTYETRARPVLDDMGRVTGTVTVSRDVTDRMQMEQSLRSASDEAARASDAKSEFLSRMSHELRTPLNAILGFAQLLELDMLPVEQQASVDQIQRAGQHLLSLINEVLDISRIESGRLSLSLEPVDVGGLLDEVTMLLTPAAEAAGLSLTVASGEERGAFVRADRQRLLQVLLNLGSNALKYNERGGSVSFRTSFSAQDRVRFEVRDTGPGIPLDQQDQLFVPFSRLGAERSAVEGTGVGLALSKQLVELMGGAIGVESLPGHGSTFWVELGSARSKPTDKGARLERPAPTYSGVPEVQDEEWPREERGAANGSAGVVPEGTGPGLADSLGVPAPSSGDAYGPGEEKRGLVVLHIEDNASNALLVEQVLARRPAVRLVSSAEAGLGLELAREYRPDLILLDLHLPDFPGDELLFRLKAIPELAGTKVVVVSADATPGRIRRMLDLGVEGYLTKPVDVEALLHLVDLEIAAMPSVST